MPWKMRPQRRKIEGGANMSFYSYKNANPACCPGMVAGNVLDGLNEKICIQVQHVCSIGDEEELKFLFSKDFCIPRFQKKGIG